MTQTARTVDVQSEAQHKALCWGVVQGATGDPRTRGILARIVRDTGVDARDPLALVTAVQAWVNRTIRYVREYPETICAPWVTVEWQIGDCDDMAILLAAVLRTARVPMRLAFGGWKPRGEPVPLGHVWSEAWVERAKAPVPPGVTVPGWVALETVRERPPGWRATDWRRVQGDCVRLETLGDRPGQLIEGEPHGEFIAR